jgi:hypothetical protein
LFSYVFTEEQRTPYKTSLKTAAMNDTRNSVLGRKIQYIPTLMPLGLKDEHENGINMKHDSQLTLQTSPEGMALTIPARLLRSKDIGGLTTWFLFWTCLSCFTRVVIIRIIRKSQNINDIKDVRKI